MKIIKIIVVGLLVALLAAGCSEPNEPKHSAVQRVDSKAETLRYECKVSGKVVKVVDGDTVYVLDRKKTVLANNYLDTN